MRIQTFQKRYLESKCGRKEDELPCKPDEGTTKARSSFKDDTILIGRDIGLDLRLFDTKIHKETASKWAFELKYGSYNELGGGAVGCVPESHSCQNQTSSPANLDLASLLEVIAPLIAPESHLYEAVSSREFRPH